MAAKFTATATSSARTVARRGREFPASVVTCTCATCNGKAVLVPTATVNALSTQLALHNYVAQAKVLGFPVA